jgi:hypothetical protein
MSNRRRRKVNVEWSKIIYGSKSIKIAIQYDSFWRFLKILKDLEFLRILLKDAEI